MLGLPGAQPFASSAVPTPDATSTTPKTASKSKKKKSPKQAVAKPPVKKKAKVAAAPTKPAADIPLVTGAASVWRGCLESKDLPRDLAPLASGLVMDEARLGSLLEEQGLLAGADSECVPFVAATGGEGGAAAAVFERTEPKADEAPTLAVRKTAAGVTVTPGACDCPEPLRRVVTLGAKDAMDTQNEVLASLPDGVRWQLGILVPRMMRSLGRGASTTLNATLNTTLNATLNAAINPTLYTAPNAAAGPDTYSVRVTIQQHASFSPAHLHSIEIIETATEKRVDGVWWLERAGSPGVLVGMEGTAYERLLWQSPVKYTQTSRGVGLSVTTARRVTAAPKGSGRKPTVKYVKVGEYHIGIDMLAPKGADVHAVGDASVAFAGRMGGYGNLVILDHGLGYKTYYAHLSKIEQGIRPGVPVARGEIVGLVGSTGHSTAPHLHFETRKDAKYIDPFDQTRQLEFWLLSADDQERLAMELLMPAPDRNDKVAKSHDTIVSPAE